ncbi:hypothetical protein [Roseomonas sp. KE2513]|uniref:hypothetical protein n=1 Tax=Roseomonas sp. KE2513 TaxID=2479202 RepID=UPI0018DEFDCA|nr:hypothetical protein [Roseomonas sp. KE2513]
MEKPGIFQSKVLTAEQLKQVLESEDVKTKWKVKAWLNTMPEEQAIAVYRDEAA